MIPSMLLALTAPASAADVLVLHSDPYFFSDVVTKLTATGKFDKVDAISALGTTPTATTLAAYDAILTYTNAPFSNPTLMGDRLADYVDAGGGVVECMFAMDAGTAPILGRFATGGYEPLTGTTVAAGVVQTLVPTFVGHPILTDVVQLSNGTASYHTNAVVSATASEVARWSNGVSAVGADASRAGRTVGVNMFPASSDALAELWNAQTDGDVLLANALLWASGDSDVDTVHDAIDNCIALANADQADADADGIGDACDLCAGEPDADLDGICDAVDACPGANDWLDLDGDGAPDACDPCPVDSPDDTDADGACDSEDVCVGSPNVDGDNDGICDSSDACRGHDDNEDTDQDGQADGCDCAPLDPLAQTDGVEVCDGIDNDCDGLVDPIGSKGGRTYYLDLDGDGYGISSDAEQGCSPPLNYANVSGDCDDDAFDVNPDAGEFCDGIDNNCDGDIDPDCTVEEEEATSVDWCACSGAVSPAAFGPWVALVLAISARRRRL